MLVACDRSSPGSPSEAHATDEASPTPTGEAAEPPGATAPADHALIDMEDPESCRACHAAVVDEWLTSQHARAHHTRDPIYDTLRTLRGQRQGEHIFTSCAQCHSPRDTETFDSPVALRGVTCATCHAVAEVREGRGAAALVAAEPGVFLGPHDVAPGASAVHGTGPSPPHMEDGRTLCLACHGAMQNPAGLPTCTTGPEHAAHGGDASCVSCHMPEQQGPSGAVSPRDRHRSHAFLGPHWAARSGDAAFSRSALRVALNVDEATGAPTLEVASAAGHDYPSGFPGRYAQVSVRALDAEGGEVWSSASVEDVQAFRMARFYADDAGQPEMAPFATQLVADTRATSEGPRRMPLPVPAEAVQLRVCIDLHLSPPPMIERIGAEPGGDLGPVRVFEGIWRRTDAGWVL